MHVTTLPVAARLLLLFSVGAAARTLTASVVLSTNNDTALLARQSLACMVAATPCPSAEIEGTNPSDASHLFETGDPSAASLWGKYIHRHKHLKPLSLWDVAGFVATAVALVLAASGGIGGGGLLIPIYMLVFGFRTPTAVALSNVTIAGGTLANFVFNVGRRNPLKPGPLVDWDLILVMEPSTILGAIAGGYINHVLPPWLTTVSLSVLLAFVTANLVRKGKATYRKESHQLKHALSSASQLGGFKLDDSGEDGNENEPAGTDEDDVKRSPRASWHPLPGAQQQAAGNPASLPVPIPSAKTATSAGAGAGTAGPTLPASNLTTAASLAQVDELQEPLLQEPEPNLLGTQAWRDRQDVWTPEVPLAKLGLLLALLAGVVVSDTLRTNLPCPSIGYWLAALSMVPVTILMLLGVRRHLLNKHAHNSAALQLAPVEGEVVWDSRSTLLYPTLCTFAGLVAGLFGVGGGIIKGPLMLEMGVNPQVAAATSATMILFTSTSASVVFISFGAVMWDYAAVFFVIALVFTAVGQLATKWLMSRMQGRSSVIVFAMAIIMGASTLVLAIQGVLVTREAFQAHTEWEWGSICKASSA